MITKIVDYELGSEAYEGAWHVEGMPHENIVATGLYILQRDEGIEGGDLMFKRAFLMREAAHMHMHLGQNNADITRNFAGDFCHALLYDDPATTPTGMFPLGRISTPEGRMIVFPNSHVHRLSKMMNAEFSGVDTALVRRIIVFFLVNPDVEIVSTKHVSAPQQESMLREDANLHRLALMKERRLHKQDWNVREIGLCEH